MLEVGLIVEGEGIGEISRIVESGVSGGKIENSNEVPTSEKIGKGSI